MAIRDLASWTQSKFSWVSPSGQNPSVLKGLSRRGGPGKRAVDRSACSVSSSRSGKRVRSNVKQNKTKNNGVWARSSHVLLLLLLLGAWPPLHGSLELFLHYLSAKKTKQKKSCISMNSYKYCLMVLKKCHAP